ncbi:MAG: hypothetical protein U0768_19790 [Anaerolineae bacterium]
MKPQNLLRVYADADVLFRAATASHEYTAAIVLLRMAEFTLLDVVSAAYTVEEALRALRTYLPDQAPLLLQLVGRSIRVVDDPSPSLLQAYKTQAHWKDVINLAAAVDAQAHVLGTYNVRDYRPQPGVVRIMTPGELVTASREAVYLTLGAAPD